MGRGNLLIIANPCSGKGKARKIAPKVASVLADAGYAVNLKFTERRGDAQYFASEMGYETIVAIGGDGTLNEVVTGMVVTGKKDVSLGYIPLGSTNDFGRSVGIPKNWKKATKLIVDGVDKGIDICKFNDDYFAYVAAYGMFAKTSCSVSQKLKNKLGHFAYLLLGVKEVFRKNNYHVKIEVDGRLIDDTYAFLGFGNTKSIGGILKFKDDVVEMSDGLFEVLLVKYPKSLWQLSKMLRRFNRSEWQGDGLEMIHAKKAKVFVEKEMLWSLDGEKRMLKSDFEVENIPQAIKLKVKK